MVKIHKLILKNFKSFKKAEIPIADGFTVIAGSNGSGKSNVLDAMLFVMGTSSLKTMRASKLTELVNNNSVENYARVDMEIKHDGKNYLISRMIDKQGKCIYRLDGAKVTRNEISSLLGELGIKPDGHNVVMQGDVTRVIEMSPEERRQIIDEMAGLQEFDEKKGEALKNLDKVESKIRDTNIVLNERESYLQELERERESALKFDGLENEKKQLKATILFTEMEKVGGKVEENKKKGNEAREKKTEFQVKVGELETRAREEKEKAKVLGEEILAANEKIFSTIGAKLEEKKSEARVGAERIERKKEIIEKNHGRIGALRVRQKGLEEEGKNLEEEKAQIKTELPGIGTKIAEFSEKKGKIESLHSSKQSEIEKFETMVKELSEKIDSFNEKALFESAEAGKLEHSQALEEEKLRELTSVKEKLEKAIAELEKQQRLLESIHAREQEPVEALKKARQGFEDKIRKSREKKAEASAQTEKVKLLEKKIAECPVCESRLEDEKRQSLLTKARESVKKNLTDQARLEEDEKEMRKRISELEELVSRETELVIMLKELGPKREENKILGERLETVKKGLGEKGVLEHKASAERIREKASQLGAEKEQLSLKRNELLKQLRLEEMDKINVALGELQTEKSLSMQRLEQIEKALGSRLEKESKDNANEIKALEEESKELEKEIEGEKERAAGLEQEAVELESKFSRAEEENRAKIRRKDEAEKRAEETNERLSAQFLKIKGLEQQEKEVEVENSGLEVRLSDLSEEFDQFKGEKRLEQGETAKMQSRLSDVEKELAGLGAINMKAIESFNELAREVKEVRAKIEKLEEEQIAVLGLIEKIEFKRTNVFMDCFRELRGHFTKTFRHLFSGDGMLNLSNEETPLESGLIIEAKHKGRALQNIDSMSGGEKTLTALAFLFALQLYEPAPFYIFDEADAALDKENSVKMVNVIKEISKKSQFIAITHNDPLIKEADQIIGVALNKDKSSVIGLKLREKIFEEEAGTAQD